MKLTPINVYCVFFYTYEATYIGCYLSHRNTEYSGNIKLITGIFCTHSLNCIAAHDYLKIKECSTTGAEVYEMIVPIECTTTGVCHKYSGKNMYRYVILEDRIILWV